MKFFDVKRTIRASWLFLVLAVMTGLPTFAQSNANGNANTRVERTDRTETRTVERDNDTDWGWLGLLGLLGLAGLLPKKRRVEVQEFRDTGAARPGSGTGAVH